MLRRIIEIDQEKCNGCGACANACHEGAIGMVEGKATLLRDDYCDGLGNCLPACPTGAINFVEREAAAYDEAAVQARMQAAQAAAENGAAGTNAAFGSSSAQKAAAPTAQHACGCPGSAMKTITRPSAQEGAFGAPAAASAQSAAAPFAAATACAARSLLAQWPVQIQLGPVNAP